MERSFFDGQGLARLAHQNRTIRWETDPDASAIEVYRGADGLDNLSAGCISAIGSANAGLKIIANALRADEHLQDPMA